MRVCEPFEAAYQREQERLHWQDEQKAEDWLFDRTNLEEMVQRWGSRQLLCALAVIHHEQVRDGCEVRWRILSPADLAREAEIHPPYHPDDW